MVSERGDKKRGVHAAAEHARERCKRKEGRGGGLFHAIAKRLRDPFGEMWHPEINTEKGGEGGTFFSVPSLHPEVQHYLVPSKKYLAATALVALAAYVVGGLDAAITFGGISALGFLASRPFKRPWWKWALLIGAGGVLMQNPALLIAAGVAIVGDIMLMSHHTQTGLNEIHHDDH